MSIALPIPAPQHNHLLAHLPPCFSSVGTLPRSPLRRGGPSPGSDPSPISSLSQGLPGDGSLPAGMPEAGAAPFRFHNSSCPARGGWETPGAVTGRQRASRGRPPRLREAALSPPHPRLPVPPLPVPLPRRRVAPRGAQLRPRPRSRSPTERSPSGTALRPSPIPGSGPVSPCQGPGGCSNAFCHRVPLWQSWKWPRCVSATWRWASCCSPRIAQPEGTQDTPGLGPREWHR